MTRLFIPQIGNELKLISNWDCKIFSEQLNASVFKALNIDWSQHRNTNVDITFPKGTVLRVDRLYVRAPASSFDSITFRITACPMKALVKARFFVKLMDANNIEFEEIIQSIGGFKKLKESYRFVALTNNYINSENLKPKDAHLVSKELYEHFSQTKSSIRLEFDISIENLFGTIVQFIDYSKRETAFQNLSKLREENKKEYTHTPVVLHLLPVLDGYLYYYEINERAVQADKALDIYQKEGTGYDAGKIAGSYLSRQEYKTITDKSLPALLRYQEDNFEDVKIHYQGNDLTFKTYAEFGKFLKKCQKE